MKQLTNDTGTRTEQLGVAITQRSGELATHAMAAKAKAQVEARYVIAYNRPRNIEQARQDILDACKRPHFAESARYKKPVGGGTIDGFSIRFAEEAIKAMKNINVESTTIYEDEHKRTVNITVTDLENNLTYGKEVTVAKTVERKSLKAGQVPISQRQNSTGQITYLVEATEDEIANKIASAESKIIRNCGLRLVPSDILEEAEIAIAETSSSGGGDPKAKIKKVSDAFASLNIRVTELEKYLGHGIDTVSDKELSDLRAIFAAIKDGEASWSDYVGDQPARSKPDLGLKKAGEPITAGTPKPGSPTPPVATAATPINPPESSEDGDLGPEPKPTPPDAAPAATESQPELPDSVGKLKMVGDREGIPFDAIKKWYVQSGHAPHAANWTSYADITEEEAKPVIVQRVLKNLLLICKPE